MRTAATILAITAGLLISGPAQAAAPTTTEAEAIALQAWGPAPCGKVTVTYDDWTVGQMAYTQPIYDDLAASPCTIHLSPDFEGRLDRDDAQLRCHTVVHEWGHLTGHRHTRRGVMARVIKGGYYWRCRQAAGKEHR